MKSLWAVVVIAGGIIAALTLSLTGVGVSSAATVSPESVRVGSVASRSRRGGVFVGGSRGGRYSGGGGFSGGGK